MTLEERVVRLETENRRLKMGALVAVALLVTIAAASRAVGAAAAPAAKAPAVIEAQRFVLKDANGIARAMLGEFDGAIGLGLLPAGKGEKTEVMLTVNPDGSAALRVSDKSGRSVGLSAGSEIAGISISDTSGKTVANFSVRANGAAVVLNDHVIR